MNDEDKLIQNLQSKLKQTQTTLDTRTLGQLRAARRTAIESLNNKPAQWWQLTITRYAISGTFALALVIGILFPKFYQQNEQYDLDIIAINEDIELLEDLDFYLWIADTVENES